MITRNETTSRDQPLPGLRRAVPDLEDREQVIAKHLPLVRRLCFRFSHSGVPMEDLVQIGCIGLLKAIAKFDPDRGSVFLAFAVPVVIGEVKNYFRDHGWAVKIPRKLQRQKLEVDRAIERLNQRLRRSPTVHEIAEEAGFSEEEVFDTFEMGKYGRLLSLDAEYHENGSGEESSLKDYLGRDDPHMVDLVDRLDLTDILGYLDPRERAIITLKFYSDMSQAEIAKQLGISQMHVSRLQRKALNKLKATLTD